MQIWFYTDVPISSKNKLPYQLGAPMKTNVDEHWYYVEKATHLGTSFTVSPESNFCEQPNLALSNRVKMPVT